jgi:hypothetical protein
MSLVQTLMQPLRTEYMGQFDKNEARASRYGAWDFFNQDSRRPDSIFDSDIRAKIKQSFGNSVVVPVLDARTVTIGNTRSCTIADDENTSKLVTLTFATYSFGFSMYPSQYKNNDIKYQQDFTRKLKVYLLQLAALLDSQAITTLENAKNTVWTGIDAYYPEVGDALQVTQAQKNDLYNNLQAILETMDFYSKPHIISSTSGSPMVRRLVNQGAGNAINEEFQLEPYEWHYTNRIPNDTGIQSTLYAVPEGTCAIETRVDPDSEAGHSAMGGGIQWSKVNVPLPGSPYSLEMGSLYRDDCSDASGLQTPNTGVAGLTATKRESFQWSIDMVMSTAYNSSPSTRYNPIVKTEISAT